MVRLRRLLELAFLPDASGALPSVSGEHRRRVRSRSRGRRSRSSSDRTDRRAKKRSRRRSPSLERSSRRREKRYRSSSDSSEDERAAASSPRARRACAGGSTWDYGRPRSYARVDPDQSGTRRRSPGPSGVADDDRSTTFESVDFARDDSFRAVLALIQEFHDMAEPATVPGARCKTSLASAYGLAADSYPAFSFAAFPLVIDTPDRHKLGLVQVYGGPDCARLSSRARSPTTEVLRHLHLLFSWTLHGPAWLDLHYHGES